MSIEDGSSYGVLIGGVGGTGVVTIGALLGMAAHIDGKGTSIVDQLGFAQKGGPVTTHIRFANSTDDINSPRINAGSADLVIGCDMLVVGGDAVLDTCDHDRTTAIMNTQKTITGDFTRDPDLVYPADTIRSRLEDALDDSRLTWIDASAIATKLLGDSIGSNLFLVGYAWQRGLLPLSRNAIFKAIELNGVKAEWNQQAFEWGRRAAHNLDAVLDLIDGGEGDQAPKSLDELIEDRATDLIAYQDEAYARRYRDLVARVREAEQSRAPGKSGLSEAVARYAYKLMAYKDEYEVARLYADPRFRAALESQFSGDYRLEFHLAPPWLTGDADDGGRPRKRRFGQWMLEAFKLLARLRGLRGTPFDPFGYSADRRLERQLIRAYEARMDELLGKLDARNHALVLAIASIPEGIRGFGHVKRAHVEAAREREAELLQTLSAGQAPSEAA